MNILRRLRLTLRQLFSDREEKVIIEMGHVYTLPNTREEWRWGRDVCIYCGYHDKKRTRYTKPPCERTYPE